MSEQPTDILPADIRQYIKDRKIDGKKYRADTAGDQVLVYSDRGRHIEVREVTRTTPTVVVVEINGVETKFRRGPTLRVDASMREIGGGNDFYRKSAKPVNLATIAAACWSHLERLNQTRIVETRNQARALLVDAHLQVNEMVDLDHLGGIVTLAKELVERIETSRSIEAREG